MTSVNVQTKDLHGEASIAKEHIDNNAAVRKMLTERGIVPENLPCRRGCEKGGTPTGKRGEKDVREEKEIEGLAILDSYC